MRQTRRRQADMTLAISKLLSARWSLMYWQASRTWLSIGGWMTVNRFRAAVTIAQADLSPEFRIAPFPCPALMTVKQVAEMRLVRSSGRKKPVWQISTASWSFMPVGARTKVNPLVIPIGELPDDDRSDESSRREQQNITRSADKFRPWFFTTLTANGEIENITFIPSGRSIKNRDNRWPLIGVKPATRWALNEYPAAGDHFALQPYFSYSRHSEKKPIVHIASDIAVTASLLALLANPTGNPAY